MSAPLLDALARTEDQAQLADAVARFVRDHYDYRAWRAIADAEPGISVERWADMARLGWLGIGLPEADGGFGTLFDALQVVESLAAGLAAEPLASTTVVCGDLLARAGSEAQRAQWLPSLLEGRARWALADAERDVPSTRAEAGASGWRLDGTKWLVADAPHADHLIVAAQVEGATALFVVPGSADGVAMQRLRGFDRRRIANVSFQGVALPDGALLGPPGGKTAALLERARHRQIAALAAEAAGLGATLLQMTREYLSGREQFGVKLATFQVLQHRMVDMAIALEELRTAARLAALACEAEAGAAPLVAAAAVAVARTGRKIGREAVQLHGGMGMTDELPVGDYMKRLEAIALRVGPDDAHLDRLAQSTHSKEEG